MVKPDGAVIMEAGQDLSAENTRHDLHLWLDVLLDAAEAEGYSGQLSLNIDMKTGRIICAESNTRRRRHVRRSA